MSQLIVHPGIIGGYIQSNEADNQINNKTLKQFASSFKDIIQRQITNPNPELCSQ